MAENVVKIEFQADDSSTTAAFSRLNSEVSNLGGAGIGKAQSAMADWRKETGLSEQATIGASREMASLGNKAGKTAADFKPATAEMRAASTAIKGVGLDAESSGGFMGQLAGRLIGVSAAFEVLRLAAEGVKYVISSSMDLESADVRFKSLAGNTDAATQAFAGMSQVAEHTNTSVVELSKAGTTLLEAGVPMDQLTDKLEVMGQQAKISGENLQEVANVQLRLSRGEVGSRDLSMISRVTGDETGRLQAQYKDISVTIPLIAKEMERTQRATERTRQDADRLATRTTQDANLAVTRGQHDRDLKLSAETSFGEAHGGADIFKAFQTGGSVSSLAGMHGGGQAAIQAVMTQLREGVAQIGKEEGVDAMSLVREGVIGNEEVLAAGGRAREARETAAARGREDTDTKAARGREDAGTAESRGNQDAQAALELRKEREKKQLIDDARNQLAGTGDSPVWDSVQRDTNYRKYLGTAEGQKDTITQGLQRDASHAGSAVNSAYDIEAGAAGTVALPWSKPTGGKADDIRPNLNPAASPKNASELTKVEDPKMHSLIEQLLKVFATSS